MDGFIRIVILEIIAEMKKPEDFPKANRVAFSVVMVVYTITAVLTYLNLTPSDSKYLVCISLIRKRIALIHPPIHRID